MSGLVGKGVRSYKKAIVSDSNFPALGFRNFIMAFQTDAMGVGAGVSVDLTSALTVPSEMVAAGFEQPDPITIGNAQLGNFRNNVIVTSNLNGILIDRISYTLTNDSITFDDGLNANEIIVIKRGNEAVTGNRIVDARPLRATGNLDYNQTSGAIFQVGEGFRIAPSTTSTGGIDNRQIGFVQVFVDGVLQSRNVGNADETSVTTQTGNYREVIVDGLGNLLSTQNGVTANAIQLNPMQPFAMMDPIIVISTNLIVDSPNSTGVIDQIDSVGARVTGVETDVTANTAASAANTTRSTANTSELATIPSAVGATPADILQVNAGATAYELVTPGGGGNNLFQRRNLSGNLSSTTPDIASLRFANLTVGNIYRVTLQADFSFAQFNPNGDVQLQALNDGNILCAARGSYIFNNATGVDGRLLVGTSAIFTAGATTCTFTFTETNSLASSQADLLPTTTFSQLEELNNYAVTTNFTP